ncbi:MAG: type I-G CRISPR-associated protein, Cas3-extension family [Pirellulales bacterium]
MTCDHILAGLDGGNPLGFLAAIGTFVELSSAAPRQFRMNWAVTSGIWRPCLHAENNFAPADVANLLAKRLGGGTVMGQEAECLQGRLDAADEKQMKAKKLLKNKLDEIKRRKLRGQERNEVIETEASPLIEDYEAKRAEWLKLLEQASPSPELALGKDPAATPDHFRMIAQRIAEDNRLATDRRCSDLIAAFGCESVFDEKSAKVRTTPFCFVTGSGHQYFLETVHELLSCVTASRLAESLFVAGPYMDERLSLRWDPVEDRRYAMMWADPTSSGNKARTNWALNLLAYRGLQLLPSVPIGRGLATTGFSWLSAVPEWTWPLWTAPIGVDVLRSLLARSELQEERPNRRVLSALGVVEVYRSSRIQVGNPPLHKLNFSQARTV